PAGAAGGGLSAAPPGPGRTVRWTARAGREPSRTHAYVPATTRAPHAATSPAITAVSRSRANLYRRRSAGVGDEEPRIPCSISRQW
ncbi:MAG: hypothetical protein KDC33_09590, partial [Thermoleophilia bacterium]|nr:hypothetical protein [Thermoleophilia bacterium]